MSKQTRNRVASRLLARAEASKRKPAQPALQPAQSPKQDDGPRVVGYRPDEPAWADPTWRPAATGPAVSESLAAWQRAQEWAALRARCGGGGYDDMGNRIDRAPAGFHPLFGWKL